MNPTEPSKPSGTHSARVRVLGFIAVALFLIWVKAIQVGNHRQTPSPIARTADDVKAQEVAFKEMQHPVFMTKGGLPTPGSIEAERWTSEMVGPPFPVPTPADPWTALLAIMALGVGLYAGGEAKYSNREDWIAVAMLGIPGGLFLLFVSAVTGSLDSLVDVLALSPREFLAEPIGLIGGVGLAVLALWRGLPVLPELLGAIARGIKSILGNIFMGIFEGIGILIGILVDLCRGLVSARANRFQR